MSMDINRRHFLGLATVISGEAILPVAAKAAAGDEIQIPTLARAEEVHSELVREISRRLDKVPIYTKQGVLLLIDYAAESGAISRADAELLKSLVEKILDRKTVDGLDAELEAFFKETVEKASEVVQVIFGIARSSIKTAKEILHSEDAQKILYVVAKDIGGAVVGAAAGKKFGKTAALIAAVGGGVAESISAANTRLNAKPAAAVPVLNPKPN